MTRTLALSTVAALASIGLLNTQGATAAALSSNGAQFLSAAIQIDMAEIQDGQLAQARSQNPAVQDFAKMMVADHTKAKADATALAGSMQVDVPTGPSEAANAEYQKLGQLSGAAFDKAFLNQMIAGHRQAIAAFGVESTTGDIQVAQLTQNELPTLQKHLDMAQSLLTKIGGKK
jgi:putative membrane protein